MSENQTSRRNKSFIIAEIMEMLIGEIFERGLLDAGVFKRNDSGKKYL